jgi:glucokinase
MSINVGLDLGGSFLKYGWGRDSIIGIDRVAVVDPSREAIYQLILEVLQHIEQKSGESIQGIVIGVPGCVNPDTGTVLGVAPNLKGWEGANPAEFLRSHGYTRVRVENDANLMVYGEASEWDFRYDVLGITIGTGIGSGFVSGSQLFRGASFSAFELGHTIVVPNGLPCNCGKRGCLEVYTAVPALLRATEDFYRRQPGKKVDKLTIADVFMAMKTDKPLQRVIRRHLDRLALGLANAVTMVNPDKVVVGGGVIEIDAFDWDWFRKRVKAYLQPVHKSNLEMVKARFGNRAGVLGGIRLATQEPVDKDSE